MKPAAVTQHGARATAEAVSEPPRCGCTTPRGQMLGRAGSLPLADGTCYAHRRLERELRTVAGSRPLPHGDFHTRPPRGSE